MAAPVLLFDGVCNLCNAVVNFVLDRERDMTLQFAALQSDAGRALLEKHGVATTCESVVLVENGAAFSESTAALRVTRYLRLPWRMAIALVLIPRFLRDPVYRWVARNRYRWFGRTETCRVPTPELKSRFLA